MKTAMMAKWGNSLALRIPSRIVEELGLKAGDSMNVDVSSGEITLKKVRTIKRYALKDIMGCFHTADEAAEVDWGVPQGKELW